MIYSDIQVENVNCPNCGCEKGSVLYSVSAEEVAQNFVLREVAEERFIALVEVICRLWGTGEARSVVCSSCGLGYAFPYVAGDSDFYALAYLGGGYPEGKWEHQITVDALQATIRKNPDVQILEIGAGNGHFLNLLPEDYNLSENVVCTEFTDHGIKHLQALGVDCYQKDIWELQTALKDRFNAICLFQVFEHLDNNMELLKMLAGLSKSKADLFITVPNPDWTEFNEMNGALLDLPPNHIGRWGVKQLSTLAVKAGWELIDHRIEPVFWFKDSKRFLIYLYKQKALKPGSLAHRVEVSNPLCRGLFRMMVVTVYGLAALQRLFQLRNPRLGGCLWMHLRKTS